MAIVLDRWQLADCADRIAASDHLSMESYSDDDFVVVVVVVVNRRECRWKIGTEMCEARTDRIGLCRQSHDKNDDWKLN